MPESSAYQSIDSRCEVVFKLPFADFDVLRFLSLLNMVQMLPFLHLLQLKM